MKSKGKMGQKVRKKEHDEKHPFSRKVIYLLLVIFCIKFFNNFVVILI